MTEPRDELLERYAQAAAQDPRRPSERVRHAARAHAQMLRDQASEVKRAEGSAPNRTAANQPRWTLYLVASLAVVGLAGLLYVQIDRGEPQDREIALGAPSPSALTAPRVPTVPTAQRALSAPPAQNAAPALAKAAPPGVYSAGPAEAAPSPTPVPAPALAAAPAVTDASRSRQAMVVSTAAAPFLQAARGGQVEILQRLLAQGVAINTRDDKGNTALILAVTYRQLEVARTLLEMGADPALVNNEGWTALRLASQLDMPDMVLLLQTPR